MKPERIAAIASSWLNNETQRVVTEIDRVAQWNGTFPRPLEEVIELALEVMIVPIASLGTSAANHWFMSRGRERFFEAGNRSLHGCMLGYKDAGFIFVDGNDPLDERRFTIAHEVGHYISDHLLPRRRAIARFGPAIREVLNGERPPTIAERFKSVMTGLPIGPHTNLMERVAGGRNALELYASEEGADRIALALLAPPDEVLVRCNDSLEHEEQRQAMVALLAGTFGLPPSIAADYATALLARTGANSSPYDRLRA